MTEEKKSKPWYRRRRFLCPALLLVLAYFCLVPSRLKISPETTLITEPLTPDGRPDYFGAYEKTWASKLSPPEDNGLRMMIAAIGPRMLEMHALANETAWENIPTDEKFGGKKWFEQRWLPLCEHMYIDPYSKPKFYDSLGFTGYMRKQAKNLSKEENAENLDKVLELYKKLAVTPWKSEDYPEAAAWLKERDPVLDLFGVAVRKPNFVCWRPRTDGGCISILLPDVQATRDYVRDLQIRITERVGRGDVDGAWHDVMSMYHLSRRHFCNDPIMVTKLVGTSADFMGCESAALILKHGNPSREQLDRFARDLASLPSSLTVDPTFENVMIFDTLHLVARQVDDAAGIFEDNPHRLTVMAICVLPLDLNIAGRRLTRLFEELRQGESDEEWSNNTTLWRRILKNRDNIVEAKKRKLDDEYSRWIRMPLIRTRSEMAADLLVPLFGINGGAQCEAMARYDLLRIAVALERFQKAENEYPDDLEKLVPNYLDEIPLDPFTGRKTITYKRNPEEGSPYLIYSYGRNGEDDGGREPETIQPGVDGAYEKWIKHDIVFKR